MTALRVLAPFVRKRPRTDASLCDLCSAPIGETHRHVVDVEARRMECACDTCARVFDAETGRHRTEPTRVLAVAAAPTFEEWRALGVPVGLAFFLRPSSMGRFVGIFPSPAGATESELPADAWAKIASKSAALRELRDDVEALVVRCTRSGRSQCFLAPIDVCYEMMGSLRASWTGFDGGDEARAVVDRFITDLALRASKEVA